MKKVAITQQQTPITPQFQTKLQPVTINQLVIPTPTRKLAKSPIKTTNGISPINNGNYQTSNSYQSVLQSNQTPKTPIYTNPSPNSTKGSLTPSTIKPSPTSTSTTTTTTTTNISPVVNGNQSSMNLNPISIRQSNQPILINPQNGYPIRSNNQSQQQQQPSNIQSSSSQSHSPLQQQQQQQSQSQQQPLHPHPNQQNLQHHRQSNMTQKFTLNPYTQVRKINYPQPGINPHSPHQMNTNPLLYKVKENPSNYI